MRLDLLALAALGFAGAVAPAAAAPTAPLGTAPAPAVKRLNVRAAACGLAANLIRAETLSGDIEQGTDAAGGKILFARGDDCDTVFPVGRATARTKGPFDAKGQVVKAFVLTQPPQTCRGEDEGGCTHLLVVKDRAGAYPAATPLGACEGIDVAAVPLFGAQQSAVQVTCDHSGGGDVWHHSQRLFVLGPSGLQQVLATNLGMSTSAEGQMQFEGRRDLGAACRYLAPGSVTVTQVGPAPVVQVVAPASDDPEAPFVRQTLAWDGARFAPKGAPVPAKVQSQTECGPDRPATP